MRLPPWLRVKLPTERNFAVTRGLVERRGLRTVCDGARCPNVFECFSRNVATFMVLGGVCTRRCAFCNMGAAPGKRMFEPPDPEEPGRLAEAAAELGLRHVVVTSVTRDDLADGGAEHFAAVVRALRGRLPGATCEVLIPDFKGDAGALDVVVRAGPDVINHNLETVPALYSEVRPQAVYERSLELLARVASTGIPAKSGIMVGLGEADAEVRRVVDDLAGAGCRMVTIGQYLSPSRDNRLVSRFVHPDVFAEYAEYGRSRGIRHMFCGPLVRSSYNAAKFIDNTGDCGRGEGECGGGR